MKSTATVLQRLVSRRRSPGREGIENRPKALLRLASKRVGAGPSPSTLKGGIDPLEMVRPPEL
jgi:hypothetical protein